MQRLRLRLGERAGLAFSLEDDLVVLCGAVAADPWCKNLDQTPTIPCVLVDYVLVGLPGCLAGSHDPFAQPDEFVFVVLSHDLSLHFGRSSFESPTSIVGGRADPYRPLSTPPASYRLILSHLACIGQHSLYFVTLATKTMTPDSLGRPLLPPY